jgi:uncharacterized protein with HEPN domain
MKDDSILLEHMLNACLRVREYISGCSLPDFVALHEKQDAVIRQIEIIGEAASHVSVQYKEENQAIEWRQIIGMRNLLIHQYFGVDLHETYYTSTHDIPLLIQALDEAIRKAKRK